MGTWICHLRVADRLLEMLPGLDETAFILGSLAPDSGIPNADWSDFDPPKTVTHFLVQGEGEDAVRDLRFYRAYLRGLDPADGLGRYSFALAYHFHLLCDALWVRRIYATTKVEQAELIKRLGKQAAVEQIKGDWYGLDQRFVREHPESSFWRVLIPAANPPAYLDFVPTAALGQNLDYIRRFYSQPEGDWLIERAFPYLNEATMARFVVDCAGACLEVHNILKKSPRMDELDSSLALLSSEWLLPYQSPLGDA